MSKQFNFTVAGPENLDVTNRVQTLKVSGNTWSQPNFGPTGVIAPLPSPRDPNQLLWCGACQQVRPGPTGDPEIGAGYCHTCGLSLAPLLCDRGTSWHFCGESLRVGEAHCRKCGHDNTERLMTMGLLPGRAGEIAARGNLEDEGSSFRGVREE